MSSAVVVTRSRKAGIYSTVRHDLLDKEAREKSCFSRAQRSSDLEKEELSSFSGMRHVGWIEGQMEMARINIKTWENTNMHRATSVWTRKMVTQPLTENGVYFGTVECMLVLLFKRMRQKHRGDTKSRGNFKRNGGQRDLGFELVSIGDYQVVYGVVDFIRAGIYSWKERGRRAGEKGYLGPYTTEGFSGFKIDSMINLQVRYC